jgi:hypothetical protein
MPDSEFFQRFVDSQGKSRAGNTMRPVVSEEHRALCQTDVAHCNGCRRLIDLAGI